MAETAAPSGRVADRRDRRHGETRREILAAAWVLAEQQGIAGVSLREVAARVGMRAPSLYTYFDSKAAIYDAMFAEGYAAMDADLERLRDELDPADRVGALATLLEGFIAFCQASVPRYQLMFTRVLPDWEPSPAAYASSETSYRRMLDGLAALGMTDPATIDLWTAISAGLAAQQVANDLAGDRWRRLSRDAAEMAVAHLERRQ